MNRRDFISKASLAAAALGVSSLSAQTSSTKTMSYTLAPLPYPHAALEPHIDQATMEIHHGKHHNAYVTNVNAALAKEAGFAAPADVNELISDLSKVPESIRTAVIQDGRLHVQAGAGIVYDSDPEKEWDETMNKGRALFRAVAEAAKGL